MADQNLDDKAYQDYLDDHAYKQYLAQHSSNNPQQAASSMGGDQRANGTGDRLTGELSRDYLSGLRGMIKGPSLGYLDPADLPGQYGQAFKDASEEAPMMQTAGKVAGSSLALGPLAGRVVKAIGPMGEGILSSAVRVGANAGVNAGIGYAEKPEDGGSRGSNAALGAIAGGVVSGGVEGLGQAARLSKYLGSWATKMSPEQVEAYTKNPALAEEIYGQAKNDPEALNATAQKMSSDASQKLQNDYINPRKEQISLSGVGKQISVNPSQFEGTAAHPEMQSSWAKQGNQTNVPLYEPWKAEATPIGKTQSYGKPQTQYYPGDYGFAADAPSAEVSAMTHGFEAAGKPQIVGEGLNSAGSASYATPMPGSLQMGVEPALRAKRAASAASDIAYRRNPLGLSPAETEEAQRNSNAAVKLKKSLDSVVPGADTANDEIHEALRNKEALERVGNPSSLFSSDDQASLGSIPNRSLRQYMDRNTGSNFEETADALDAAKRLNSQNRVNGLWSRPVDAAGRVLIKRGVPALNSAADAAKENAPEVQQGIMSLFRK